MISPLTDRPRVPRGTDRRQARRLKERCDVEIRAGVEILNAEEPADEGGAPLTFLGFTLDLSPGGLSVVLPSARIDERYCAQHRPLHVFVGLPDKSFEVRAKAVHCHPLDERDREKGYVIGAQVTGGAGGS